MDPIIKTYPCRSLSDDLWVTQQGGIAYQKDMSKSVSYDQAYYNKYVLYEGTKIADGINRNRVSMVEDKCHCILDVGIGSGEFMKSFPKRAYGFDINPVAVDWLTRQNSFIDPYESPIPDAIDGLTLWDTLEHMRRPSDLLLKPKVGVYVFIAMPIFRDLSKVKESKHYRPNEHFYYYTEEGLKKFMADLGYKHLETNNGETKAGRESILSFSFLRSRLVNVEELITRKVPVSVPTPAPAQTIKKPPVAPAAPSQTKGSQGFAVSSRPAR